MKHYNVWSPFVTIATDITDQFPQSEDRNKCMLVVMDYFSKLVEAYGLPNQEAFTVAEVRVKELFSSFREFMKCSGTEQLEGAGSVTKPVAPSFGIRYNRVGAAGR